MNKLFTELRRRNIFRIAGVYAVTGWILMQVVSVMTPALNLPDWVDSFFAVVLMIGFPIAMLLAWAFEMTPEGVKRAENVKDGESITDKTGRKLDYTIVGGLVVVGALIVGSQFTPQNKTGRGHETVMAKAGELAGQSIAVLPFEDFSPDKDQAYFADGIAEELLNVLARVEGLRVASRTSSFSFKERKASISEIAKALNVKHILEGSVRKAGNTLRITAQLIDTKTDEHIWSETYDRPLTAENIFVIQDEISAAIVLELNGRLDLLPETSERPTQSTEAYEAYLKGKEAYGPRTPDAIADSLDWLGRAVTLDPDFAVAHAKLSWAYILANEYAGLDQDHAEFRSQTHMDRAMLLAPQDWDVLSERAWVMPDNSPLDENLAAFDRAIAANPNNARAHRGRGWLLSSNGQLNTAMVSLEKALALDPRSAITLLNMADIFFRQDNRSGEISVLLDALRIDPDFHVTRGALAANLWDGGDVETAHRIAQSCAGALYCDSTRSLIYSALGMDDNLASLGIGFWDVYLLQKNEKTEEFIRAIARANANFPEKAYQVLQDNADVFAFYLDETPQQGMDATTMELSILWVFEKVGDPRAVQVRAALARKFEGSQPGPRDFQQAYIVAAQWRMAQNDPDGAMQWLNALADHGVATTLVQANNHWFAPLYDRPDYKAFKTRMLAIAVRDRALIEAQLENPPEIWWDPEEMLGKDKP